MICDFIETGTVVLDKNLKFSSMYFVIISPLKNMALHLNKLESHSPKDALCAKFGWNWLSGSGEEDI